MKRPDNVMTVLSQVLSAIENGGRASAYGRRVVLSGPWKDPRVFEARCPADAQWIAEHVQQDRPVIRAESVYGLNPVFVSPAVMKSHPARMIEGSPIGWARNRWGK